MAYNKLVAAECVRLSKDGYTPREIYDNYFSPKYPNTDYHGFYHTLRNWKVKYANVDTITLDKGTYPNFTAHGATVQINSSGEIVQAWIKQHSDEFNVDELIAVIKENITPALLDVPQQNHDTEYMLEIPLYDMHFPMSDYEDILSELLTTINSREYDEINIILGQDLFHNDDFRGRTSSGRPIEKFDMIDAWKKADHFWSNVIVHALKKSNRVNVIYSKGNHDETLAWAFVQLLASRFPTINVDDRLVPRKCISWKKCFIGLTHGHHKKNSDSKSLRSLFTIEYPLEFAEANVREIHAGHLHHEEAADLHGMTVRRLSSAVPTDEWSSNEGYIGAHKRFMIFEWMPEKLHAIYFL